MRALLLLPLLASVSLTGAPLSAQSTNGIMRTQIEGIDIPSIPNAPFSAKVLVTWDQPLLGGGTVSRQYYTLVARDTQGRVRRETRSFVPANSPAEPPLRSFSIADPTDSTRATCTFASMKCTLTDFRPPARMPYTGHSNSVSREDLGQQTLQTLPVVGTRETTTTPSTGRLVVSRKDQWYSADLQMDLSVVRSDPQFGKVTLTVTDLQRQEPDPTWLTIPSEFQVADARTNPPAAK